MIPIIYPYNETTFTSRGYGPLSECISCVVTETLNGEYSLTMKYPKNGINQKYLDVRNIIVCQPNHPTERQAFRISKVNRSMKDSITVIAYQLCYDFSNYVLNDQVDVFGITYAISALKYRLATPLPSNYDIQTELVNTESRFIIPIASSVRSWFGGREGSLIDIYGGEWEYDFGVARLLNRRGSDNGARLSYGVNLAEYVKEKTDDAYSSIVPYFYRRSGEEDVSVVGNSIATGYTATDKAFLLDVTDKFLSNYGKALDFKLRSRVWKEASLSTALWEVIDEGGIYYVDANLTHYYDYAYITDYAVTSERSFQFASTPPSGNRNWYSVAFPFRVEPSTHYVLNAIANQYGHCIKIQFANDNGVVVGSTVQINSNDGLLDGTFDTPASATWAIIVFVPATSVMVSEWNVVWLASQPTVADVTAFGTEYKNAHPELAADKQTITITPDLVNTEVSLGDTVHVAYDGELISSRVVKTVWNVLAEKYDTIEIGTVKQNIAQTIKSLR